MRRSFVLSIFLHLVALALLISWRSEKKPSEEAFHPRHTKNLKVRSLSQAELKKEIERSHEQQIVQTDDRLKSDKTPQTKEKIFLSKTNQSVDHNVRASRIGTFKNVLKEGVLEPNKGEKLSQLLKLAPNPKDQEQVAALKTNTGRLRSPASLGPSHASKESTKESSGPEGEGLSATDDYLRDIAVGANTLLNAKEFVFYSFYERVREKLSNEWQPRLDEEINRIVTGGKVFSGEGHTEVAVKLDERGQLTELRVLTSSGVQGLDQAATDAFQNAAPFPNPPKGMLEKDHSVRIKWDFIVIASGDANGVQVKIKRDSQGGL